ncbi:unnamed protein product [Trichobilharzia szidati]|nr:unnamed protein product [Trichobilharzia szidati]
MSKDLHQIRVTNQRDNHINRNHNDNNNNNNRNTEVDYSTYRHSSHHVGDPVQPRSDINSIHRTYETIQRNNTCKTNLSTQRQYQQQQQQSIDNQLKKPQRITKASSSSCESRILGNRPVSLDNQYNNNNKIYSKRDDYDTQWSNKDNKYSQSVLHNASHQSRNPLNNSVNNNNNVNYGITHCPVTKSDYQLRNHITKEQKSVHWSEDLDITDSSKKTVVNSANSLSNNIRVTPISPSITPTPPPPAAAAANAASASSGTTNTTISTAATTTTTNAPIFPSSTSSGYTKSYRPSPPLNDTNTVNLRRKEPQPHSPTSNLLNPSSTTRNINDFLRKRSSSPSSTTNPSNPIARSQSLYAYLSKQNEVNNKPVKPNTQSVISAIPPPKPQDPQPKLPPKQSTTNANNINCYYARGDSNTPDYSNIQRSVCSSLYGADNTLISNASATSQVTSTNAKPTSPSLQKSTNQIKYDRPTTDSNQSNGPNLSLQIYLPDRTSRYVSVNNTTTVLQTLQNLTQSNQKILNMRHALVERIPVLQIERCLEDDEYLLDYLLDWKTENENLIFFEERQDMYGLFESPKNWLGEHYTTTNINSNKNIFNRNESITLPSHTDQLYLRIGETKWKRRYLHINPDGLYFSKQKSVDKNSLRRLNIFQPNLYLFCTMANQTNSELPTPFRLVIRPNSSQHVDPRMTVEMCALSEDSWKIWYSLLRIALFGKRLYTNYIVRSDIVKIHRENCSRMDYQLRNSSNFSSITDRPTSLATYDLENEQILGDVHSSLGPSSKTSSIDIGFPPKSSSYSVTDLSKPLYLNSSSMNGNHHHHHHDYRPNEASSLTSLTLYPIQTSRDQSGNRQSRLDKRNIKSVKKRIFGSGPSARRCTRSISQISSPFNITLPQWMRASYEDKVNERFNETVL